MTKNTTLPKAIVVGALILSALLVPGSAQEQFTLQDTLAASKMAGACGILDSLIQFQQTTKMQGGDEFVARFWTVEAARLGLTVPELSDQCNRWVPLYDKLWNAAEQLQ